MPHIKRQSGKKLSQEKDNKDTKETGCNCPTGCLSGISIGSPSDEDISIECSNFQCTAVPYLHEKCYQRWERELVQVIHHDNRRAHNWTKEFSERMLWDPKGYDCVWKKCKCPSCGGYLKRTIQDDKAKKLKEQPVKKIASGDNKKSNQQLPPLVQTQKRIAGYAGSQTIEPDFHSLSVSQMGAKFKKELAKSGEAHKLPIGMTQPTKTKKKGDRTRGASGNFDTVKRSQNKDSRMRTNSDGFGEKSEFSDSKSEGTESRTTASVILDEEQKENVEMKENEEEEEDEGAGEWEVVTAKRHLPKAPKQRPPKRPKRKKLPSPPEQSVGTDGMTRNGPLNISSDKSVASKWSDLASSPNSNFDQIYQERRHDHCFPLPGISASQWSDDSDCDNEGGLFATGLDKELDTLITIGQKLIKQQQPNVQKPVSCLPTLAETKTFPSVPSKPAPVKPIAHPSSLSHAPASKPWLILPPKNIQQDYESMIPESGAFHVTSHSHAYMVKHLKMGPWFSFDGYNEAQIRLEFIFANVKV